MKICSKCKIEKPFEAFHKNKNSKDGHAWECKECKSIRIKESKTNPIMQLQKIARGSIMLENKILAKEGKRLCSGCKSIFNISDMSSGAICYPCKRERELIYRNTEYGKNAKQKRDKKYYNNNKDIISEKAKEYREKNKENPKKYFHLPLKKKTKNHLEKLAHLKNMSESNVLEELINKAYEEYREYK